jgi:hypothetical protein
LKKVTASFIEKDIDMILDLGDGSDILFDLTSLSYFK